MGKKGKKPIGSHPQGMFIAYDKVIVDEIMVVKSGKYCHMH